MAEIFTAASAALIAMRRVVHRARVIHLALDAIHDDDNTTSIGAVLGDALGELDSEATRLSAALGEHRRAFSAHDRALAEGSPDA